MTRHLPSLLQVAGAGVLVGAGFAVATLVGAVALGVALLVFGVALERPVRADAP